MLVVTCLCHTGMQILECYSMFPASISINGFRCKPLPRIENFRKSWHRRENLPHRYNQVDTSGAQRALQRRDLSFKASIHYNNHCFLGSKEFSFQIISLFQFCCYRTCVRFLGSRNFCE